MQYIVKFLKNMLPKTLPKPLGRWNNDCYSKTNKKIDFANEDHCGPCGQNLLDSNLGVVNKNVINSHVINKNVLNKEIEIFKD